MTQEKIKVWWDPEADFLEVIFANKSGFMRETNDDRVMVKVDDEGNVLGFHILHASSLKGAPFDVELAPVETESIASADGAE